VSNFGQTLFGSSAIIRWSLSPFLIIFAVVMPLVGDKWTPLSVAMLVGLELMCLALLAGFWLPARYGHWAFRAVASLVFLAYASYIIKEFFFSSTQFSVSRNRGESSPFNALLGFILIGLPSLWFALNGRFSFRAGVSKEQLAAERLAYEQRILRPDWAFYERHLQRPVPAALRSLYADQALVTAGLIKYSDTHVINSFEALDEQGLLDTRDQVGCDVVAIATTDCGDPIYLRPGSSEPDKVYVTYHDGGDTEVIAESIAVMLEKLKLAKKIAEAADD